MKRLCIYITYDFENIVDDYIGYMLHELRKVVNYLVVVCNYRFITQGIENIQPYADAIYYRDNVGFDAGAYKDALCKYIGWDKVCRYDELLLINDSFYGPLYPIGDVFNAMEKMDIDYWGITRSPAGKLGNGHRYDSHIQSFFLGFKENVIQDGEFQKFWIDMNYPNTLDQTVAAFEIGLNKLLSKRGFKGNSLMDMCQLKTQFAENDNPYIRYPLELIRDVHIPIFKRKSLILYNKGFGDALEALKYIDANCSYDIEFIRNHLFRINRMTNSPELINYARLERFYYSHPRIYIYGAGMYGRNLAKYFDYRKWSFEGFLVTCVKDQTTDCNAIDSVDITKNDGIIIAIGNSKNFMEILNVLENYCSSEQIYNIEYDWE